MRDLVGELNNNVHNRLSYRPQQSLIATFPEALTYNHFKITYYVYIYCLARSGIQNANLPFYVHSKHRGKTPLSPNQGFSCKAS